MREPQFHRIGHQSVSQCKGLYFTYTLYNTTDFNYLFCYLFLKDREILVNELRHSGFLDVFEVSKTDTSNPNCNELEYQWGCLLCNHPDKAVGFLNGSNQPMIEGQLKEKKGKWRLFRRWRTRYFTLSGAHLSCKGSVS